MENKGEKKQIIGPIKCKECGCEFAYITTEDEKGKIFVKYKSGGLSGKFELINNKVECPICNSIESIKTN